MKLLFVTVVVLVALISGAVPLSAHHSWPVNNTQLVTVKGTVLDFTWENPHPMMTLEVRSDDGKVEKWGSEFAPTPLMMRNFKVGWSRDSIKVGDQIRLTCAPHKTPGATACLAREMHINGKLVALSADQAKQVLAAGGQ